MMMMYLNIMVLIEIVKHMESSGDAKAAMEGLQGEEFYGGELNIEVCI